MGKLGKIVFLVLIIGCSSPSSEPPLAKVEGKITYKGEVLKGGQVTFHHDMGRPYTADISPDGTYKTEVAAGKGKVTVNYREPGKEEKGGKPGMLVPGKSLIPDKYSNQQTSKLTFEVKPGTNKAEFNLE